MGLLLRVLLGLALAARLGASSPIVEVDPCGKAHSICVALRAEPSEATRENARRAIRETLLSTDPAVRTEAFAILQMLSRKQDLFPYLDLLESYEPLEERKGSARDLADFIEVRSAPRSRRIDVLKGVILKGEERLPRGTILPRSAAIYLAARTGLDEFEPAIGEYLAAHEPERLRQRNLHTVPALIELCRWAENFYDGPRAAFDRLLEMSEPVLEERFAEDEGFRDAVFSLTGSAPCYAGAPERDREPCPQMRQLVLRQIAYRTGPGGRVHPRHVTAKADWVESIQRMALPYGLPHAAASEAASPPIVRVRPREGRGRPNRELSMNPCTLPDLGELRHQSNHFGKYYAILREVIGTSAREVNVVDGLTGHRPGDRVLLELDIRSRSGDAPDFPVAVSLRLTGNAPGSIRVAGTTHSCREMTYFWTQKNTRGTVRPTGARIEYVLGREARVAGFLPSPKEARRLEPVWAATERLEVVFGETDAAADRQNRDGEARYETRPGSTPAPPLSAWPNSIRKMLEVAGVDSVLLGPDLERTLPIVLAPFRAYVAIWNDFDQRDEIPGRVTTRAEAGKVGGNSEREPAEAGVVGDFRRLLHRRTRRLPGLDHDARALPPEADRLGTARKRHGRGRDGSGRWHFDPTRYSFTGVGRSHGAPLFRASLSRLQRPSIPCRDECDGSIGHGYQPLRHTAENPSFESTNALISRYDLIRPIFSSLSKNRLRHGLCLPRRDVLLADDNSHPMEFLRGGP